MNEQQQSRMGRPKIGPAIMVRLPDELVAAIDELAYDADIPRAEQIRRLLAAALDCASCSGETL